MKQTVVRSEKALPVFINADDLQWTVIGNGKLVYENVRLLVQHSENISVRIVAEYMGDELKALVRSRNVALAEKEFELSDLDDTDMLIVNTGNAVLDDKIQSDAKQRKILVFKPCFPGESDFTLVERVKPVNGVNGTVKLPAIRGQQNTEQWWKSLASKFVLVFLLMVVGHLIISYLPLPSLEEIWTGARPYFNYQFFFFILAGFLAQMVDGTLGMGYGVTSATCLMTFGISPVSVSAAIHTSEIFTTATSGYSHYKFGNVNKKMFRHLVIPGVIGAVLGAIMLVFVGEKYGKWLMPIIALYAMFLGLKILIKAFQQPKKSKKIKRLGWLAGAGGFLDSFGGGGWGPIVTSTLISKGRSPRFTIGTVNLTEFFITMASALTFFISVGVSHWNVVLGLLIGGGVASPLAARMAGKLPRKTMMIAVGIMIMVWCARMIIKSL
jgi:uncharacterized membrane protein YfcA